MIQKGPKIAKIMVQKWFKNGQKLVKKGPNMVQYDPKMVKKMAQKWFKMVQKWSKYGLKRF